MPEISKYVPMLPYRFYPVVGGRIDWDFQVPATWNLEYGTGTALFDVACDVVHLFSGDTEAVVMHNATVEPGSERGIVCRFDKDVAGMRRGRIWDMCNLITQEICNYETNRINPASAIEKNRCAH